MATVLIHLLNGLSHASTLFLMAAGLSLIFGVTRVINFAHGSFYMLGALVCAHGVTHWFPSWGQSPWLYALAMLLSAGLAALGGAVVELLLLRRMRGSGELYQLVATFGLTLFLHDLLMGLLGSQEVFAPRFPGMKGAVAIGDSFFPVWQLAVLCVGPLVWLGMWGFLNHTRMGLRVQALSQDAGMLDALGVNPKPLMLVVVMLGCGLAGLGGALQLPREPAHLQMDVNVVVETFVVVVMGGLGSVSGAALAALIIGLVHAVGVSLWPSATLVLVFLTMAVVLIIKPTGLLGQPLTSETRHSPQVFQTSVWDSKIGVLLSIGVTVWMIWAGMSQDAGDAYWMALVVDACLLAMLGLSLQVMMALGGLVSFGHAAFFALGAYAAAWVHLRWDLPLAGALAFAMAVPTAVAMLFGAVVVRSGGVYLAMLTLALAQTLWAVEVQWTSVTGGDNGLIGLRLVLDEHRTVFSVAMVMTSLMLTWGIRTGITSRWGLALQAVRDAPARAQASGISVNQIKYQAFVLGALLAGLAGGLLAAHKGVVFPSLGSVATSVDALLVVLLGGVHQLWGAWLGSLFLTWATAVLGNDFQYWRGVLGLVMMVVMVGAPSGVLTWMQLRWAGWRRDERQQP